MHFSNYNIITRYEIFEKRIIAIFFLISFFLLSELAVDAARGILVGSDLSHQSGKLGAYRALIIGINDYRDPKIPDLETAVNDARAMAELLRERYGFQVKLILDRKATKEAIYQALRNLALSTKSDDSVLIYYAGHGDLDRTYNDGWWIPVDAKGGKPLTYLDNVQVQKAMRSMKARHVLLISDSCYSGTLFGQARAMPSVIDEKYYLALYNEKSRWGMTSGNKTPVSDRGTSGHSVFAYQLLKELKKNDKPHVSIQEIYVRIAPIIGNNSEQTPLCRPIRNAGDKGGEFIFVSSSDSMDIAVDARLLAERNLLEQERIELARIKIKIERERIGAERKQVEEESSALKDKRKREEKLNQEKIQSKQLAYIPNTAARSSDNDIVYNKLDGEKRHSLAVFPFCESAIKNTTVQEQKEFTDFIIKYTNNIPNIILTHSFYPYYKHKPDARLRLINILINEDLEKEIWYGNSAFPRKKPDYNVLKNLAKKIKSDLVLTFKIASSITHTNEFCVTYNGYLVDIEKNIDYEKIHREYYNEESIGLTDFDILKIMTKDLFELYLNSNPQLGAKY